MSLSEWRLLQISPIQRNKRTAYPGKNDQGAGIVDN